MAITEQFTEIVITSNLLHVRYKTSCWTHRKGEFKYNFASRFHTRSSAIICSVYVHMICLAVTVCGDYQLYECVDVHVISCAVKKCMIAGLCLFWGRKRKEEMEEVAQMAWLLSHSLKWKYYRECVCAFLELRTNDILVNVFDANGHVHDWDVKSVEHVHDRNERRFIKDAGRKDSAFRNLAQDLWFYGREGG